MSDLLSDLMSDLVSDLVSDLACGQGAAAFGNQVLGSSPGNVNEGSEAGLSPWSVPAARRCALQVATAAREEVFLEVQLRQRGPFEW